MPGPADYSRSIYRSSGPRFIIGIKTGEILTKLREKIPGVGEYNLTNDKRHSSRKRMPEYSFGTASRSSKNSRTEAPSPLSYNPMKHTKKAPQAFIPQASRFESAPLKRDRSEKHVAKAYGLAASSTNSQTPGTGDYYLPSTFAHR